MSIITSDYITNIPHSPDSRLKPVNGRQFISALKSTYSSSAVTNANKLFQAMNNRQFSGAEAFKGRWNSARMGQNLSIADQRYIDSIVKHYDVGRLFSMPKRAS